MKVTHSTRDIGDRIQTTFLPCGSAHVVNDQYPYFVYVEESEDRAKTKRFVTLLWLEQ